MSKLRPAQMLSPAKKLTKEELRNKPWLVALIRERIQEIKAHQRAKQTEKARTSEDQPELDLD